MNKLDLLLRYYDRTDRLHPLANLLNGYNDTAKLYKTYYIGRDKNNFMYYIILLKINTGDIHSYNTKFKNGQTIYIVDETSMHRLHSENEILDWVKECKDRRIR